MEEWIGWEHVLTFPLEMISLRNDLDVKLDTAWAEQVVKKSANLASCGLTTYILLS